MSRPTSQKLFPAQRPPKLPDQECNALRLKQYFIRTLGILRQLNPALQPTPQQAPSCRDGHPRSGSVPHPFGRQ